MPALSFRAAIAVGGIAIFGSLFALQPAAAAGNEIEIREWNVPYEGRPRDPFAAGPDEVWFVGQVNGYLGRLTPSTGKFFKRDLGEGTGPHNLIVDDNGIVWFAGNRNAYIGRYDPKTDKIERIEMPDRAAADPHTLIFDGDQSHIWFTVQGGNFIGRLDLADRSVKLAPVPTKNARPYGIKTAPDGTVWAALLGTNKLASADPETLAITEYTIPVTDARPRRLEVTQDGRVWYSDYARGVLGRYDAKAKSFAEWSLPSGAESRPYGPPFISKIVKEDRCHLNGMAMEDGVPRYVTAVSKSDTIDGWRDRRFDGGILIDVATGETVIGGLSMPHSPRIYADKLWVLNSGTGEIGWIERGASAEESKFHALAFCPGYVRGLAFHGKYAFVGLSKPRYQRFEGLALDKKLAETDSEPWCGVQVIDLNTGTCVHWFRIDGPVSELYDVGIVPGVVRPMSLSFASNDILVLTTHDPLEEGAVSG